MKVKDGFLPKLRHYWVLYRAFPRNSAPAFKTLHLLWFLKYKNGNHCHFYLYVYLAMISIMEGSKDSCNHGPPFFSVLQKHANTTAST